MVDGWGDLLLEKMIAFVHVEPEPDDDLEFLPEDPPKEEPPPPPVEEEVVVVKKVRPRAAPPQRGAHRRGAGRGDSPAAFSAVPALINHRRSRSHRHSPRSA